MESSTSQKPDAFKSEGSRTISGGSREAFTKALGGVPTAKSIKEIDSANSPKGKKAPGSIRCS